MNVLVDRLTRRALPASLLLSSGCSGPTDAEIGGAVLLAAPVALLVTAGFIALLLRAWPDPASVPPPWRGWGVAFGVHVLVAIAAAPFVRGEAVSLAGPGLAIFGTSYLALTLLAWRIWFAVRPSSAALGAPLLVSLILLPPAALLAFEVVGHGEMGWAVMLFIFPGYLGAVPAVLLLAFFLEAWIRRRRLAARP